MPVRSVLSYSDMAHAAAASAGSPKLPRPDAAAWLKYANTAAGTMPLLRTHAAYYMLFCRPPPVEHMSQDIVRPAARMKPLRRSLTRGRPRLSLLRFAAAGERPRARTPAQCTPVATSPYTHAFTALPVRCARRGTVPSRSAPSRSAVSNMRPQKPERMASDRKCAVLAWACARTHE